MLPEIGLSPGTCTLWEEDLLLDYTIEIEDERFKVHKVVMASASDYFKAMLNGGMVESRQDKVKLEGLTPLAVRNVIEFIYTGQFGSAKAGSEELLACAVYLQIPAAIEACNSSAILLDVGLAKGVHTLWKEHLLLDYTILVEDQQFKVHKVIMASVSDYFKVMLTGGMVEGQTDRVRLEGLSLLAVKNMIEFIYTGQFGAIKVSLEELLACAMYLQIPTAIKACTVSMCEEVDNDNCFRIRTIFRSYALKDGTEYTNNFIKLNFEAIMEGCNPEELTYDNLLFYIDCWERSEWRLFSITKKWLITDFERMNKHGNDLMSRIRFCLMSPTEVASVKDMDIFSDTDGPWKDLVEKAVIYHNLPTHQKVLDESEQAKVRREQAPVCFEILASITHHPFAVEGRSWVRCETINPPVCSGDYAPSTAYTEVNNFLIMYDDSHWYIYDPRNSTWSTMASMGVPRTGFALVHHDQHLYALGGHLRDSQIGQPIVTSDVIEKYDYMTNTWIVINSRFPALWMGHDAHSIGSRIYFTHLTNHQLDVFDPNTGEWSQKDVPTQNLHFTNKLVLELDGEKVLAALDTEFKVYYYKPSIDQWLVYNHSLTSTPNVYKYMYARLLGKGNTIFFLGFPNSLLHSCEKWTLGEQVPTIDVLDTFPTGGLFHYFDSNFCVLLSHAR